MFPTKTVVFMSAFLMAAPFGLSSSAVSAYPGEGIMEGARDMQQDMNQAKRDFRDLKENNSDRGSYREDRDMRRPPRDGMRDGDRDMRRPPRDGMRDGDRDMRRPPRDGMRYDDRDMRRPPRGGMRYDDRGMRRPPRDGMRDGGRDMRRHDNGRHEGWDCGRGHGRDDD